MFVKLHPGENTLSQQCLVAHWTLNVSQGLCLLCGNKFKTFNEFISGSITTRNKYFDEPVCGSVVNFRAKNFFVPNRTMFRRREHTFRTVDRVEKGFSSSTTITAGTTVSTIKRRHQGPAFCHEHCRSVAIDLVNFLIRYQYENR